VVSTEKGKKKKKKKTHDLHKNNKRGVQLQFCVDTII
jgi:hypothetical protein